MYPEKPTEKEKTNMAELVEAFSWMYPCSICAEDFREKIQRWPVRDFLDSREEFVNWMCE